MPIGIHSDDKHGPVIGGVEVPKFDRNQHRFFDGLVTFLSSMSNLAIAVAAAHSGVAGVFLPTEYATLEGSPTITNVELRFFPRQLVMDIANNGWPSTITLTEHPLGPSQLPPAQVTLTGLQLYQQQILAGVFGTYYENSVDQARSTFGNDVTAWPNEWNFGRVVRNALSHGNRIHFANPSATPVQWRGVIVSPADNGMHVFPQTLNAVELIYLMDDMDSSLP